MERLCAAILMSLMALTGLFSVIARDSLHDGRIVTPTPVVFPPPRFGEPELICPYFRDVQSGPGWNGIIIGRSTQDDLENVLEQLGEYEIALPVEGTLANSIGY